MKYESALAIVRAVEALDRAGDLFSALRGLPDIPSGHQINGIRYGQELMESAERWRGLLQEMTRGGVEVTLASS